MSRLNGHSGKRLLIVSDTYPTDLTDGKHLRVYNICNELCKMYNCYFVALADDIESILDPTGIPFSEIGGFRKRGQKSVPLIKRFRLSDARYLSTSSPEFYAGAVDCLEELVDRWSIDAVVNFEPGLAEATMTLKVPVLLDYPDCTTLMLERRLANRKDRLSRRESLKLNIKKLRASNRERYFLNNVARTVTISAQDRERLIRVSGVNDQRVLEVPNGVSLDIFRAAANPQRNNRHIVFWGNLSFPPNWTAVDFFFESVFKPHLADKGVVWHIVGGGADERIRQIGQHPSVVLAGFQDNLAAYMSTMGAMVNPMVEGGGLKNKVLEAFAMRLPVVSTALGAAAINCRPEEHLLIADDPSEFAQQVLRVLDHDDLANDLSNNAFDLVSTEYAWPTIGQKYASIVGELLE